MVRLRLAEPTPDGGVWSSRKVADVIAAHLGLERVLPQRGWDALQALSYSLQRPRPKNPKYQGSASRSFSDDKERQFKV